MKKYVVLLMIFFQSLFLFSSSSFAFETLESALKEFADVIAAKSEVRGCTYHTNFGKFIPTKDTKSDVKKKNPNLLEQYDVTISRDCSGEPSNLQLHIVWSTEKIEGACVAKTFVNKNQDPNVNVKKDSNFDISFCTLENYLQLSNMTTANPWWDWAQEIAQNNSNWQ